jgi:RecA/RadA recombinase
MADEKNLYTRTCETCGKNFQSKRPEARFHSTACRMKAQRKSEPSPVKQAAEKVKEQVEKVQATVDPQADYQRRLEGFIKMGMPKVEWITTGIADFDALTKIPRGRVTQIQGPYAVGKTTLALNMIKGLHDHKVLYIDSEAALNPELLAKLGLDPKQFTLYNDSPYIEDIYTKILEAAKSGKYDMIIFDSLAGTTFRTETAGSPSDRNIGQKAFIANKLMRIVPMILKDTNTALVIINQEREVINSYVPQKYTPGGMAVPYAASLIVGLKTIPSWRFPKESTNGQFHGHEIEATIIKNKVGMPHVKKKFKLYYPEATLSLHEERTADEPAF